MTIVPPACEQTTEGVLHRARGRGVDMALHCRQVHDVLAKEILGQLDSLGRSPSA
jgi:hypothetical protein